MRKSSFPIGFDARGLAATYTCSGITAYSALKKTRGQGTHA
jgi:hypothetical protein